MFCDLCGEEALENVILVTNMWEKVPMRVGEAHEKKLAANLFWPALDGGAHLARHNNTVKSARDIVRRIMENSPITLRIQRELVDECKDITDTAAGEAVKKELSKQIRYCRAEVEALQEMRGRLKWEEKEKRQELANKSHRVQHQIARMTVRLEEMMSHYCQKKRQVDKVLREMQGKACRESETQELWERMKKLRMDLECMASSHREEKRRTEEVMRQERKRAGAAYKELRDIFNDSAAEREAMKLQIDELLQNQWTQSQPTTNLGRNGLCVVCQDEEANTAVVDCG